MDYQTPGVYIREVDSGPKPIAAAATSIPGFLGLFAFEPTADAIAVTGTTDDTEVTAKLLPSVVDEKGAIKVPDQAVPQLIQQFGLNKGKVANIKSLMELCGHKPQLSKSGEDKVKISVTGTKEAVEVSAEVINTTGRVLVADEDVVTKLFDQVNAAFPISDPKPKTVEELLSAYGYEFGGAKGTSMFADYSVPPWPVTNKGEFFSWLQSFFAQYLVDTEDVSKLVDVEDPSDADALADAVFEALTSDDTLKTRFQDFLSQQSVFHFVSGVSGFYDNGGGKAYVYLQGVENLQGSIVGDEVLKTGLNAFNDCIDMAIMAAPGTATHQQQEVLEFCERRKDRFAVLDGPIVSLGDTPIPASDRGFGAMYLPWVKVTKPSWFTGEQEITIEGPLRRKLVKASSNEVYVPPSGHVVGLMARVDGDRGVHKAPANEIVMGITGISQSINATEQGQYNTRGINVIRDLGDRGIRVWGARTLATISNPEWKYVNVRRLFIMIEQSILSGMQWAVFEPNDQLLWSKLKRDTSAFLMRVWRSGALFGKTAEEAFYVKCDSETNPRYLIDAGQVNVEVGISPVKPAEFVVFSIGQWDGGASISE